MFGDCVVFGRWNVETMMALALAIYHVVSLAVTIEVSNAKLMRADVSNAS